MSSLVVEYAGATSGFLSPWIMNNQKKIHYRNLASSKWKIMPMYIYGSFETLEYQGATIALVEGFWMAFGSGSWWVNNVPNNLCSEIQLFTLNKKMQRTLMSSKSWSGVLEDSGSFWLGFCFLTMMEMGLQCPKLPMFRNSAFYIE